MKVRKSNLSLGGVLLSLCSISKSVPLNDLLFLVGNRLHGKLGQLERVVVVLVGLVRVFALR